MIPECGNIDAVVVGGGFYGSVIAIYLAKNRGLRNVFLLERQSDIFSRASYANQARIHNGYHYPRSFRTAFRSQVNSPRFLKDWAFAVKRDFLKVYAVPKHNSKVSPKQFKRFCDNIGATIKPGGPALKKLFNSNIISDIFVAEEYVFDAIQLSIWALRELRKAGVVIYTSTMVTEIKRSTSDKSLTVCFLSEAGDPYQIDCNYVVNCSYSGLNQVSGDFTGTQMKLKHEVAELALLKVPDSLKDIGVTVVDGPFFSLLPFPSRNLHSLSHVRYTPHVTWEDQYGIDPYKVMNMDDRDSMVDRMLRDAGRYLPSLRDAEYVDSLYEIKTVLAKNETDDGRPILFEKYTELAGYYSVLGGKIDNIYDVLEKLESENFESAWP